MIWTCLPILLLSLRPFASSADTQRPFYLIGHMVNSIGLIEPFLKSGSNVLESDVRFRPDGSVKHLYHGFPCDMCRVCEDMEDVGDYLETVRELTDPRAKDGYYGQLAMLFFDLKMGSSGDKWRSGVDVARHLVEHLWSRDKSREQEIRVLLYIENELNSDFIVGFIEGLKHLGLEHRLRDIGFDGGRGDIDKIRQMLESLNVTTNVWQGDGITNFIRPFRGDKELGRLLSVRDSESGFIRKVYDWTVDTKPSMRKSLLLGVDGMITNKPRIMLEVLVAEMEISVESPEPSTGDASETQLITYLQNILKVQIMPMKFSTLRELVEEAPKKMKLYDYIEDKYPDVQFLDFLRKYPNIFTVNRDRTVVLVDGNSFTKGRPKQLENRSQDVVDGQDRKEYISDSESSEDDENLNDEGRRLLESPVAGDTVDGVRTRTVTDSSVSSISDSSVDVFSSEIVQTSDSLASSCSSNSSLDN